MIRQHVGLVSARVVEPLLMRLGFRREWYLTTDTLGVPYEDWRWRR